MRIVIDASLALAWCFADEWDEASQAVLVDVARHGACVPALWWPEVSNALLVGEIRNRISRADVDEQIENLGRLPLITQSPPDTDTLRRILDIARSHRLTTYDASYIELARRLNLPIATRDKDMIDAAKAEGIDLVLA